MLFWRISGHADLTGFGAKLSSGRWHTAASGKRIVYLAEHPSVALLENLVNLTGVPEFMPTHFQLLKIVAPDGVDSADLPATQLSAIASENTAATQALGDAWLASGSSAILRVPSIPSPESWNYLLNPLHPKAASLKIEWAKPIAYDRRLFQLTHA